MEDDFTSLTFRCLKSVGVHTEADLFGFLSGVSSGEEPFEALRMEIVEKNQGRRNLKKVMVEIKDFCQQKGWNFDKEVIS